MSDDILDLEGFRRRKAEQLEAAQPRTSTRVYTDGDGDVCMDHGELDVVIAFPPDLAVDLGLLLVAEANPKLFDEIVGALEARKRKRRRRRRNG